MDLSERIATWREHKGLSQEELAELVGVTKAAVYQWEDDGEHSTTPTMANLEKIVDALGLTLERFFGRLPRRAS